MPCGPIALVVRSGRVRDTRRGPPTIRDWRPQRSIFGDRAAGAHARRTLAANEARSGAAPAGLGHEQVAARPERQVARASRPRATTSTFAARPMRATQGPPRGPRRPVGEAGRRMAPILPVGDQRRTPSVRARRGRRATSRGEHKGRVPRVPGNGLALVIGAGHPDLATRLAARGQAATDAGRDAQHHAHVLAGRGVERNRLATRRLAAGSAKAHRAAHGLGRTEQRHPKPAVRGHLEGGRSVGLVGGAAKPSERSQDRRARGRVDGRAHRRGQRGVVFEMVVAGTAVDDGAR